jgi:hypothetical protein
MCITRSGYQIIYRTPLHHLRNFLLPLGVEGKIPFMTQFLYSILLPIEDQQTSLEAPETVLFVKCCVSIIACVH